MHKSRRVLGATLVCVLATLTPCCGADPEVAHLAGVEATACLPQAILGGTPTGPQAFSPVGVLVKTDRYGQALGLCTGTLIAPDVVLTAAHCLRQRKGAEAADWQMWFSVHSDAFVDGAGAFAQTHPPRVAHTMLHPSYDGNAALDAPLAWRAAKNADEATVLARLAELCASPPEQHVMEVAYWQCVTALPADLQRALGVDAGAVTMNDVALALLETPVVGTQLALLPTAATAPVVPQQQMHAVGYGTFDASRPLGQQGQRHVGPVRLDGVGQFELQVDFADSQIAMGDSGGPLFVAGDAALEVMGIASRSLIDAHGRIQGPTLYSQTQAFTPWLRQALRQACRAGLRSVDMCQQHPF